MILGAVCVFFVSQQRERERETTHTQRTHTELRHDPHLIIEDPRRRRRISQPRLYIPITVSCIPSHPQQTHPHTLKNQNPPSLLDNGHLGFMTLTKFLPFQNTLGYLSLICFHAMIHLLIYLLTMHVN